MLVTKKVSSSPQGRSENYKHFNFDTQHTLPQHDVTHSVVNEVAGRLTGVNHKTVSEFHGFRAGGAEFARNDNLATLGIRFHNKTEDTVTCTEPKVSQDTIKLWRPTYRRTASPAISLYLKLSHCAIAERPRC